MQTLIFVQHRLSLQKVALMEAPQAVLLAPAVQLLRAQDMRAGLVEPIPTTLTVVAAVVLVVILGLVEKVDRLADQAIVVLRALEEPVVAGAKVSILPAVAVVVVV
jgi:hypothetical protein